MLGWQIYKIVSKLISYVILQSLGVSVDEHYCNFYKSKIFFWYDWENYGIIFEEFQVNSIAFQSYWLILQGSHMESLSMAYQVFCK